MTSIPDETAPEELIRAALGALGERFSTGVLIFDNALDVQWASGATSLVLGWDIERLSGMNALELVHPDDIPMVVSIVEPVLEDPGSMLARPTAAQTVELMVRIKAQDGSWRPVLVAGRVIALDGHVVVPARSGEARAALARVVQLDPIRVVFSVTYSGDRAGRRRPASNQVAGGKLLVGDSG